jgi:hypothetical protein
MRNKMKIPDPEAEREFTESEFQRITQGIRTPNPDALWLQFGETRITVRQKSPFDLNYVDLDSLIRRKVERKLYSEPYAELRKSFLARTDDEARVIPIAVHEPAHMYFAPANLEPVRFHDRVQYRAAGKTDHGRRERVFGFLWIALVVLGIIWGFVAASSLVAGVGVGPATAVFGIFGVLGLATTLLVAKATSERHVAK